MITVDRISLLAEIEGTTTLKDAEAELRAQGLTLSVAPSTKTHSSLADWLAEGAVGARDAWLDPADHLLAGIEATLKNGTALCIRPAPRRAVGPDLMALFVGMRGRFGTINRAWMRVHPIGIARPVSPPFVVEENPAMTSEEEALLAALEQELARR